MFYIVCIIILLILYKLQRYLCSQPISVSKKLIIPAICFLISIIGLIYVNEVISNNQLTSCSREDTDTIINQTYNSDSYASYTITDADDGKNIANIGFSKGKLHMKDAIKVLLLFNIPTMAFSIFIFTGKRTMKLNLEND